MTRSGFANERLRSLFLTLLLTCYLPDQVLERAALHHLVGDHSRAASELRRTLEANPGDQAVAAAYITALALKGSERDAISGYKILRARFGKGCDPDGQLLEKVAWACIENGVRSSSSTTRLLASIAAAFAQDSRAVPLLLQMLRSQAAHERLIAIQLSATMRDTPLKQEVARLATAERILPVRLAAIEAVGTLQMSEMREALALRISDERCVAEEKAVSIAAMIAMMEARQEEINQLAANSRAGLRQLACEAIGRLDLREMHEILFSRLSDSHPDVRRSALAALGRLHPNWSDKLEVASKVEPLLDDADKVVAIQAAWLLTLAESAKGLKALRTGLRNKGDEIARLAAGAVATLGPYGAEIAAEEFQSHSDPYVRANLAIGLIGQRQHVEQAAKVVHEVLRLERRRWMWEETPGTSFRFLAPSRVRHEAVMTNQPEVVNQLVRLEVLGYLAVVRYPQAQTAVREFLKEQLSGVAGAAALSLIEEGDNAALELVRELLNDPDPQIRVQAALSLASFGRDPASIEVLESAYGLSDRKTKIKILESLANIASPDSLPFLIDRLEERSQTLRLIAACAIMKCLYG